MYSVDINYDELFYTSTLFEEYFAGVSVGVFDIETTGLDPIRNKFVLGGLLTPLQEGVRIRQFFSEGGHEEAETLELYREALAECDVLVSYNGNSFDIPFLKGRLAKHHRGALHEFTSLDLYRVISKHSDIRNHLPNLKQKTVENFLGFWSSRMDEISGADSVYLYHEYVATKKGELREYILLHNRDDVRQLARILKVLDKLDLHSILSDTGFPVMCKDMNLQIKGIRLSKSKLEVSGRHDWVDYECKYYNDDISADISPDGDFRLSMLCINESKSIYTDIGGRSVPGQIGRYLVLKEEERINHAAINRLIKNILLDIIDSEVRLG